MAERRMFAKTIIDSDAFLELPITAQLLYFHLAIRADDDGFINKPRAIMSMIGAKNEDMQTLIKNKFVILFDDSGIVVIKHWRIHNYIQKDRYKETKYKFEKASLYIDENQAYSQNSQVEYTKCIQNVYGMDTQDRLGKDRLGKDSIGEERIDQNRSIYESNDAPIDSDLEEKRQSAYEALRSAGINV